MYTGYALPFVAVGALVVIVQALTAIDENEEGVPVPFDLIPYKVALLLDVEDKSITAVLILLVDALVPENNTPCSVIAAFVFPTNVKVKSSNRQLSPTVINVVDVVTVDDIVQVCVFIPLIHTPDGITKLFSLYVPGYIQIVVPLVATANAAVIVLNGNPLIDAVPSLPLTVSTTVILPPIKNPDIMFDELVIVLLVNVCVSVVPTTFPVGTTFVVTT